MPIPPIPTKCIGPTSVGSFVAGAAFLVEEKDFHVEPLGDMINRFFAKPEEAHVMVQKALSCAMPNAVELLAQEVINLSGKS